MNAPGPDPAGDTGRHSARALLDAAAALIEKRVAAIQSGSTPLDPVVELEQVSRAIRQLASGLDRAQSPSGRGPTRVTQPIAAIRVGPPVLARRG